MKICFLAGANSLHSKIWIEYFANKGHEIHWISLSQNDSGFLENVKFYSLRNFGLKPFNILFNALFIRKLVKKIKPDILHVHYAGVNGVLGALSGFRPFMLTSWGSDILVAGKSKIKRCLIKFALNRADLITCNGESLKEEMMRMGISLRKIRFVYWGIDTKKFEPKPKDMEFRGALGIFEAPMIISLRNLEPLYSVETLIDSVPLVLRDFPKTKFVIAGKGSKEADLKRLAESLGVSGNIMFMGWIPPDKLPKYLTSADISVSTSLSDGGLSQGTGQAMACELPVITTNLEVNKAWIKDGENGFLFPTKDPKSLAGKIIILLKNEKLRIKFGKEGRRMIESKLNYYKEMEKVKGLYKELANSYKK